MKFVFVVSTNGGILSELLQHSYVADRTFCVVSDRECGAIQVAKDYGIMTKVFKTDSPREFSIELDNFFKTKMFYFISFYTKLFTYHFLNSRRKHIFNCHPALLPSFKGLNGFNDTLNSSSMFIGNTIHEVDEGMDTGESIIQAAFPLDRSIKNDANRKKLFKMQFYSALQFIRWLNDERVIKNDKWFIKGARFNQSAFSPNLDDDFFNFFKIKNEL